MFGNSAFLGRLALRETAVLGDYFTAGPQAVLDAAIAQGLAVADADSESRAMAELRIAKRRAALTIALADVEGRWDVGQVTAGLTRFADACVSGALRFLLRQEAMRAGMEERDGARLEQSLGMTVLAMGKYGAHELDYSSDIDLVVFYDAQKATAMSFAPICACVPMPAPHRSPSPPMRRWITMRLWARTGNAPP